MREKLRQIFTGRQGMDELSKLLFWAGIVLLPIAAVIVCELLRLKKAMTKPVEKA